MAVEIRQDLEAASASAYIAKHGSFAEMVGQRAYPFVAVLQSDLAETGREPIVAPLAPKARLTGTAGRLTPHVRVPDVDHVLLVPNMAAIAAEDLREHHGQLLAHREAIVAALDYLFLGV